MDDRTLEKAHALFDLGRYAEAEASVRLHLAAQPDSLPGLLLLCQSLLQQDRPDDAETAARQAVTHGPDVPVAYVLLAQALGSQGRGADALAAATEAARQDPLSPLAAYTYAVTYYSWPYVGKDRDHLLAAALNALALDPHDPDCHNLVGLCFVEKNDRARAEAAYRNALAIEPNHVGALNNLGLLMASRGKDKEALTSFTGGLRQDPQMSEAQRNLRVVVTSNLALANLFVAALAAVVTIVGDFGLALRLGCWLAGASLIGVWGAHVTSGLPQAMRRRPARLFFAGPFRTLLTSLLTALALTSLWWSIQGSPFTVDRVFVVRLVILGCAAVAAVFGMRKLL